MKLITVATMRALDRRTIQAGTPGEVLMERAGAGAVRVLLNFIRRRMDRRHAARFTVLAGKGNNGGDAWVAARHLAEADVGPVSLFSICPPTELRGAARVHAEKVPSSVAVHIGRTLPDEALGAGTFVVDGLLGTGCSGPLRPPYARWIEQVNAGNRPVAALDVPSGLDADTGAIATAAVTADLTLTMALPKQGLFSPTGMRTCGRVYCIDIGVPEEFVAEAPGCGEVVFAEDIRAQVQRRPHDSHKGTFGHVLTIGGSRQYAGAPILAGAGALRVGAGLSTVLVPTSIRPMVPTRFAALIVHDVPDAEAGRFTPDSIAVATSFFDGKQAVVIGPGSGRHEGTTALVGAALGTDLPLVIDADALRCLDRFRGRVRKRRAVTVVTPHPGEMRAVLDGLGLDELRNGTRVEQATAAARELNAFVALKGRGTILAAPDGRWAVNASGTDGLSSGGTGDVLAGMLGGLLAQGTSPWDALNIGVFLHGLAAESAPNGQRALLADDLLDSIGAAWREITPFA